MREAIEVRRLFSWSLKSDLVDLSFGFGRTWDYQNNHPKSQMKREHLLGKNQTVFVPCYCECTSVLCEARVSPCRSRAIAAGPPVRPAANSKLVPFRVEPTVIW